LNKLCDVSFFGFPGVGLDELLSGIIDYLGLNFNSEELLVRRYRIHWVGGTTTDISGVDRLDAFKQAGYGQGAVSAVDYLEDL